MRKVAFFILFSVFAFIGMAASHKEYKQIRSFIKTNNLNGAVQTIEKCKQDSAMMNDPELYMMAAEVQMKMNDVQNTKMYLKQQADTAAFFSTVYGILDNLIVCDQKESIPDKKGRVKNKNRSKIKSLLKMYYPNLFSAGLFYIKKNNYQEADKFFSMYIDAAAGPLLIGDSLQKKDPKMPRGAFWSMTSCYLLKKYKDVFKYRDLALRDTANFSLCLQYEAMSYAALNDMPNMVKELKRGIQYCGYDLFFFSHLADYYTSVKDYKSGLALCDSLLKVDSTQVMYKLAKIGYLFNTKEYAGCKRISSEIISKDSANADAYYYLASCYYNEAKEFEEKIKPDINSKAYKEQMAKVKEMFKTALPYMEKYRALRPNDTERWAPPLYRIYLSLNMGKKFSEIDAVLAKKEAEAKAQKEAEEKAKAAKK